MLVLSQEQPGEVRKADRRPAGFHLRRAAEDTCIEALGTDRAWRERQVVNLRRRRRQGNSWVRALELRRIGEAAAGTPDDERHGRAASEQAGCRAHRLTATVLAQLKQWARTVERDALAVYLAARDPRVPWYAKALALRRGLRVRHRSHSRLRSRCSATSRRDHRPARHPAVVKLVPPMSMRSHRAAPTLISEPPVSRTAALIIGLVWVAAIAADRLARLCVPRRNSS